MKLDTGYAKSGDINIAYRVFGSSVHITRPQNYQKRLFTIVAAQIISPKELNSNSKELIEQYVTQFRGKVIQHKNDNLIAVFEGPSKAVHFSIKVKDALEALNIQLAIGIDIRELAEEEVKAGSNKMENLIAAILYQAKSNQILITQTVKFLLSRSEFHITRHKSIFNVTTEETLHLYSVSSNSEPYENLKNVSNVHPPQNDSFLEDVLKYIDDNLDNELFRVDTLCLEIGISVRQLQRKLKAIINKSPNQLISSVRLHRAKELLLENRHSIAEVAYKTGFSNPSYFSKSFKKKFNLTPSVFLQKQFY